MANRERDGVTRRQFLVSSALAGSAALAAGLGRPRGSRAQPLGPGQIPANALLNNRLRDGSWSNPALPYPTSTYVDSREDPYTAGSPNPFDSKKKGFWDASVVGNKVLLWNPTVVDTRIHDVRFCNGTKWSSEPDGIVDWIPEPVARSMNGVNYYEYMILLSGIGYFPIGPNAYGHFVYGPIDGHGNDTSGPVDFDTWVASGAKRDIPRNGLTYEPVYVAFPAAGWNGRLFHYMYPFHGGPYAPFAWFFPFETVMDVQYLLAQGYAVCTHLSEFGLLDGEKNINAHDQHWWDEYAHWIASPPPPRDANGFPVLDVKMVGRYAFIDQDGNELSPPNINPDDVALLNRQLGYNYPPMPACNTAADGSLARNVVHLVKNLFWTLTREHTGTGRLTDAAYLFGHCRSSETALSINCGRLQDFAWNASFTNLHYTINGLTPRTGGNFVDPYNPAYHVDPARPQSNLVYNGFFDRAPGGVESTCTDPEYPITAPIIATEGAIDEQDISGRGIWPFHNLKKTIDAYGLDPSVYDLDKWIRFYVIDFGTHYNRSTHFATLYNGSDWFYQFGDGQPNRVGRGSRLNFYMGGLADALTRLGLPPDSAPSDPMIALVYWSPLDNAWAAPMEEGLIHRCLDNLVAWVERGVPPPRSRVWSERVLADPYQAWVPDLPLYYWSGTCIEDNPLARLWSESSAWPAICWVNDKKYLAVNFPTEPLWEAQGNLGIFYPTPHYLERWSIEGVTYDSTTRCAWSVEDTAPAPDPRCAPGESCAPLDPFWDYVFSRTLRPVRSDCCVQSFGLDDVTWDAPQTFNRDALAALGKGELFDYSTAPLQMPNIAVRLGLYVADTWMWNTGGGWPYLDPFSPDELRRGYVDPYGRRYAGYADHGDYVQKVKAAVEALVHDGLYDPAVGRAVVAAAAQSPYPLPPPARSTAKRTGTGFWSELTRRSYATPEEREQAEERIASLFGGPRRRRRTWR